MIKFRKTVRRTALMAAPGLFALIATASWTW